jgi:hypothetical protein
LPVQERKKREKIIEASAIVVLDKDPPRL